IAYLSESGKASDRKVRLFACACCRRIWQSFSDDRSGRAVEVAECFADGKATIEELDAACGSARDAALSVYWEVGRQAAWASTWRLLLTEATDDPEQDCGLIRVAESAATQA